MHLLIAIATVVAVLLPVDDALATDMAKNQKVLVSCIDFPEKALNLLGEQLVFIFLYLFYSISISIICFGYLITFFLLKWCFFVRKCIYRLFKVEFWRQLNLISTNKIEYSHEKYLYQLFRIDYSYHFFYVYSVNWIGRSF